MSMTIPTLSGDEYRERARKALATREESWQRSDTDGFLTQWAMDCAANNYIALAELADQGGRARFRGLFDLDGNLVPAKLLSTRYGEAWGILASDDPQADVVAWFRESVARDPKVRRRNNARKGYYVGLVGAPAGVKAFGSVTLTYAPVRIDGGFSWDVDVLDNGIGPCPHILVLAGVCDQCGEPVEEAIDG